jgi:hypothetical protein
MYLVVMLQSVCVTDLRIFLVQIFTICITLSQNSLQNCNIFPEDPVKWFIIGQHSTYMVSRPNIHYAQHFIILKSQIQQIVGMQQLFVTYYSMSQPQHTK